MTDRPMLFSAPMVLAILSGRKTQTRRLVKRPAECPGDYILKPEALVAPDAVWWQHPEFDRVGRSQESRYRVGDRLWVRENFTIVPATAYRMSEGVQQTVNPGDPDEAAIYAAGWDRSIPKWKPCIHMPRWASRITLDVVDVRVERLNDCSEADAIAEGTQEPALARIVGAGWSERDMYARLWEHINGAGSWAENPWVWVYTFARVG